MEAKRPELMGEDEGDAPVPPEYIAKSSIDESKKKVRVEIIDDGEEDAPLHPSGEGETTKKKAAIAATPSLPATRPRPVQLTSPRGGVSQIILSKSAAMASHAQSAVQPDGPAASPPQSSDISNELGNEASSIPILQAKLVEEASENSVYDAVQVEEEVLPWWRKHLKWIVLCVGLIVVALIVGFVVALGTGPVYDAALLDLNLTASPSPTISESPSMQPT